MVDDLRDLDSSLFYDDDENQDKPGFYSPDDIEDFANYEDETDNMLLGMTPSQRFVIALILFLMTCLLGAFCLILTEKMVLL